MRASLRLRGPIPTPRPPLPPADPSQPLTCAWQGFATSPMLLQRACSSGLLPACFRPGSREPHPSLHAGPPGRLHPSTPGPACQPLGSPPPPLPAMIALPRSLIHVGRPPAMAPSTFVPYSPPRTLMPTAPAGASRKPPLATASTRRATGAPFTKGTRRHPTRVCRPRRTLVPLVGRPLPLRRTQWLNGREMKPFGERRPRDWPKGRLWWAITLGESS